MTEDEIVRVEDVMRRSLHIVDGLASVQEAIEAMDQHSVGSLVIERRHDGDEFGLVTVYDIAEKVLSEGRSVARTSVYEIMNKPALTISAGMNVKYAIRLLSRMRASRALVTQNDELVGLVTLRDMVVRYVDTTETGR